MANIANKIVIIGNSSSGKSTLARELQQRQNLAHLDLDTLAWLPTQPPTRSPLNEAAKAIHDFTTRHDAWVIEGCYTDLAELALAAADELVFMNLPVTQCLDNARQRPWEPHKYDTAEAQDANLAMLLDWIAEYHSREGTFSYTAHCTLYKNYAGNKRMFTSNEAAAMYQPPTDIPEAMQHYLRMWNELDPSQVRAQLDRCVAEDCLWVDPLHAHTGRDALEENVHGFRKEYPDAQLRLGSNVDGHNNRYRYEWLIIANGELLIRGFDVTTLNDAGLIERVDGFFGELERTE